MEVVVEFVFWLVVELVLSLFGEIAVELGLFAIADGSRAGGHPALAAVGYTILGGVLGALSLLILPNHLIRDPVLSLVYLVLSPVVGGLGMATIGVLRTRRGQSLIRLDSFGCGFAFAFAFALVRWQFAG